MYRPSRLSLASLLVGLAIGLGQAVVFTVAVSRAYPPAIVPRGGFALLDAYGGLVVLSVGCVFVSIRYRLALPGSSALVAPVGAFLRERGAPSLDVDLVGGFVVISRDDFLLTYPSAWLLWLFVFSLAGVGEYAVRCRVGVLPTPRSIDLPLSVGEYRALAFAAVVGVLHALLLVRFSFRFGFFAEPGEFPVVLWAAVGMAVLAAVPVWLLAERRFVTPFLAFVGLLYLTVDGQLHAGPDDPLGLWFLAWPVFLLVCLLPGAIEYGLRHLGRRLRPTVA